MVQIRRISFIKPRYAVRDSLGAVTLWQGRFGREGASAEIDGERYLVRRDGRKRFVLEAGEGELGAAERDGRQWKVSTGGNEYALAKRSAWRSTFELRLAGSALGTVSHKRRNVICDLPDDLPPTVQAFVGFVAMALWGREAAASSSGAVAATGS
jgi:hypothetical protein